MNCKTRLSLLWLFIFVILSGCANVYEPPSQTEAAANITVKNVHGFINWINLELQSIDNKSSGLGIFPKRNYRVHPGRHTFTIFTLFNKGFFNGPFETISDVTADLKPSQNYFIHADVIGSRVLIWVSDSSGKKVSPVTSTGYNRSPEVSTIIMIPAT